MSRKRKLFIVGSQIEYGNWMQSELVDKIEDADLVCMTGGEDVSPELYGEPRHPATMCNPERDAVEWAVLDKAIALGKKIVGICRGAQIVCAKSGGKLVQDQQIQPHYHWMDTRDSGPILVSSTHHQAQWPWNLAKDEFSVMGYTRGLSKWHHDGNGKEIVSNSGRIEVEVCKYHKIKALGIQPHPEYYYGHKGKDFENSIAYFQNLLNAHMEE